MEIEVSGDRVVIHAVQFDHSVDPANPIIEIVDTLIICRCNDDECDICNNIYTVSNFTHLNDTTPEEQLETEQTAIVTAFALNVRSAADVNSNVIGWLHRGDVVTILETRGITHVWHRVSNGRTTGWAYGRYLQIQWIRY